MIKRLSALIIALVIIISIISCGNDSGNNTKDIKNNENNGEAEMQNDAQSGEPEMTDPRDIPDNLPEADLGGRDFNILCHEMLTVEFVAEEENGDIVNDALYKRNLKVSERFNANINMINIPGTWNDRDSFMGTVRKSVQSGESTYDLVAGVTSYIPNLIPDNIFMNISKIGNLDFNKPWWGEDLIHEFSIGDRLYLVTGDVALSMWDCIFVFYFNKQLVQDNSLPDLYELVKNRQWTYDKFVDLSKTVSKDLNGDGKFNKEDMFGFVTTTGTVVNAFPGAFDLKITQKDKNNIPYPQLDTGKWTDVAAKLVELHYDTQSTLTLPDGSDHTIVQMFEENRVLFYPQTLSFSRDFRAMETDFGILPFPIYDNTQDNYYSVVRNAMSLIGVPVTASNPDECGLILEALAAESYKIVIPAYYDVALKVKQTRDDESGEMLDIIRDNLWVNFGYSYNMSTGNVGNYMRELIEKKSPNFMSMYDSTFEQRTAIFDKFIEDVLNLE
ncbi:MAG: extracellular solute-binding protein [Oscillospiraceae bacterium]|nr:extracellular solute-binding protein [Oscillospiraceae bacterium]